MDANLWFSNHTGLPKGSFSRNQDGISFGGPLQIPGVYKQRDKTYFFGLFEHLNLSSPTANFFTVPDANMRSGNFAELLGNQVGTDALGRPIYSGQIYDPRSGRAITAGQTDPKTGRMATATGYIRDPITNNNLSNVHNQLNPLGAKIISYYPAPTASGLVNNLVLNGNSPAESNEYPCASTKTSVKHHASSRATHTSLNIRRGNPHFTALQIQPTWARLLETIGGTSSRATATHSARLSPWTFMPE